MSTLFLNNQIFNRRTRQRLYPGITTSRRKLLGYLLLDDKLRLFARRTKHEEDSLEPDYEEIHHLLSTRYVSEDKLWFDKITLKRTSIRPISRQILLRHLSSSYRRGEAVFFPRWRPTSCSHRQLRLTHRYSAFAQTKSARTQPLPHHSHTSWRPKTILRNQTTFLVACSRSILLHYGTKPCIMRWKSNQTASQCYCSKALTHGNAAGSSPYRWINSNTKR